MIGTGNHGDTAITVIQPSLRIIEAASKQLYRYSKQNVEGVEKDVTTVCKQQVGYRVAQGAHSPHGYNNHAFYWTRGCMN